MEQGPFQAVCVVYIGYTDICSSLRKMNENDVFTCIYVNVRPQTYPRLYSGHTVYKKTFVCV